MTINSEISLDKTLWICQQRLDNAKSGAAHLLRLAGEVVFDKTVWRVGSEYYNNELVTIDYNKELKDVVCAITSNYMKRQSLEMQIKKIEEMIAEQK